MEVKVIVGASVMPPSVYRLKNFKFDLQRFDVDFDSGDGTADNPYLISTEAQLRKVNDNLSACYKLTADITLTSDFPCIGNSDNRFRGTFDGDNHIVKNVNVTKTGGDRCGFFGCAQGGATIKILRLNF